MVNLSALWVTKYTFDYAFWIYLGIRTTSTLFNYFWELYIDWGLLRSRQSKTFGLRDKFLFPFCFYYWAMFSNFVLRFFWLVWLWRDYNIIYGSVNLTKEL